MAGVQRPTPKFIGAVRWQALNGRQPEFLRRRLILRLGDRDVLELDFSSGFWILGGFQVANFNITGNGLVAVELDGQVVQLLATLNAAERGTARKVRAGDRLRIEAVDDTRNRCTVTYLGA